MPIEQSARPSSVVTVQSRTGQPWQFIPRAEQELPVEAAGESLW